MIARTNLLVLFLAGTLAGGTGFAAGPEPAGPQTRNADAKGGGLAVHVRVAGISIDYIGGGRIGTRPSGPRQGSVRQACARGIPGASAAGLVFRAGSRVLDTGGRVFRRCLKDLFATLRYRLTAGRN